MTRIHIYRKNEDIVKYIVEGHTGFAESGEDIVCAAVSALAMHTLNGLTDIVGVSVGFEVREAYLECVLPVDISREERTKANVLLDALYLSLKNLEKQYTKYITITELEV